MVSYHIIITKLETCSFYSFSFIIKRRRVEMLKVEMPSEELLFKFITIYSK